jgi:hypothetical protein
MGILSEFEDRVAGAIEGLFAGAFRAPVQPVELARALAKAMGDGRVVGVGSVWAPHSYTVALSPEDDEKLATFKPVLAGELATYLVDHARENSYVLRARPVVAFAVHDDLRLGRFRVSATLSEAEAEPPVRAGIEPVAAPDMATVTVGDIDHDVALRGDQVVVGRLSDCQICLADANVSRRHAAFMRLDAGWAIQDLDSTNGTLVNGEPVTRGRLSDGDVIEIGVTRLVFHEPRR